jgi:hypothetical protein
VAALIGGLGALLSDYLLFQFIRVTFQDEINKLIQSRAFSWVNGKVREHLPPKVVFYISAGIAGLVIASPLPDEIGVTILSFMATVRERTFIIISFSLNTIGILAILGAGAVI